MGTWRERGWTGHLDEGEDACHAGMSHLRLGALERRSIRHPLSLPCRLYRTPFPFCFFATLCF
eukprot:2720082-Pleurochrysis_carterae.AAC.1